MIMILEESQDENKLIYLHFILNQIHRYLFQCLKATLNNMKALLDLKAMNELRNLNLSNKLTLSKYNLYRNLIS
jgi:hypothetical protein